MFLKQLIIFRSKTFHILIKINYQNSITFTIKTHYGEKKLLQLLLIFLNYQEGRFKNGDMINKRNIWNKLNKNQAFISNSSSWKMFNSDSKTKFTIANSLITDSFLWTNLSSFDRDNIDYNEIVESIIKIWDNQINIKLMNLSDRHSLSSHLDTYYIKKNYSTVQTKEGSCECYSQNSYQVKNIINKNKFEISNLNFITQENLNLLNHERSI